MTSAQRRHPDNGIWLCGKHHTLVDSDESTYTVTELERWKADAETRAKARLRTGLSKATGPVLSPELEAAYERRALMEQEGADPEETLEINEEIARLRAAGRGDRPHLKAGDYLQNGRFRIQRLAGKGRFGDVWQAWDRTSQSIVAIKVLDGRFAQDASKRRRFFRGARQMVRLRDVPEVVNVLDFKEPSVDDSGHNHYFVMEYVGQDLEAAVKQGTFSRDRWFAVIVSIGRALSRAHERHIFHRDVKPTNILLDGEGRPRLTDFDLVRALDSHGETKTSTALGTFLFAAPEAMDDASTVGAPADVWSLGMTAIFLLRGKALPVAILRDPKAVVAKLDVPTEVRRVLERAVEWETEDRWPSVEAFCSALQEVQEVQEAEEEPTALAIVEVPAAVEIPVPVPPAVSPGVRPSWASSWGRDGYGRYAVIAVNGIEQRLRWIGPGTFQMGSPDDEEGHWEGEGPVHEATVEEGFWLADTPCTQAFWHAVMNTSPSRFKGDDRPVEKVSFADCLAFMKALDDHLGGGWGARLPSEPEWEYACRAGTTTPTYLGVATSENLDRLAWFSGNASGETHPVAGKPANAWGLFDTLGNVWEWCSDGWSKDYASPRGGPERVLRGGSWDSGARGVRAAYRRARGPGLRGGGVGFRLSRGPHELQGAEPQVKAEPEDAPRPSAGQGSRRSRRTGPAWSRASGEDEFGWWATFGMGEVEQRMRWIEPDTFWMGSPETEQGRRSNETRHQVRLTEPFWLADTPCTQALWEVVMGKNPSHFQSFDRPVERVSWDDVQRFLAALRSQDGQLAFGLPTEAQWEYACRAGTEEATWAGDLVIRGERDAPVLDPIAWYGGNSGVDFDLAEGRDSSRWSEKQHPHTRAGTRSVKGKAPNPWGLYDMLGNVWEWCADGRRPYGEDLVVDPEGPTSGPLRVFRGGSWAGHARDVRAAYRDATRPGDRFPFLGFRLSRGPEGAGGR